MEKSFGSSAHGSGRCMSRSAAISAFWGKDVQEALREKGITARATSPKSLAEEAPEAYKDVETVVDSVHGAGISLKVVRLEPIGVIKG